MIRFNQDKIERLIHEILKALTHLHELERLSDEEFFSDPHKIGSAKYNFIVAIEAIIDICNHIISKNRFKTPEDYGDTFRILMNEGLIKKDFANTLIQMARFRNRLVHIYWEIDNKELRKILKTNLQDIEKFLNILKEILGL